MKFEFSQEVSKNTQISNFQENPTSEDRVLPCGQTDKRTDMTRLIFAFHNFAIVRNNRRRRNQYVVLDYTLYVLTEDSVHSEASV